MKIGIYAREVAPSTFQLAVPCSDIISHCGGAMTVLARMRLYRPPRYLTSGETGAGVSYGEPVSGC